MSDYIFLLSGLFLGWSLGANDAANIFGTAVGTKMVRFKTAAIVGSIFVIMGAVVGGSGPVHTYGKLGEVSTLAGAFTVALSAALTVAWMTRMGLPVSTTQGIVGAIIGWDIFVGHTINRSVLSEILLTWVASPIITGLFAFLMFKVIRIIVYRVRIHLVTLDFLTRLGLIVIGAFGAYSLGANNIANVMGVFVKANPFNDIKVLNLHISSTQILFFIGGVSIATGIFTYSKKVMKSVGREIFKLSPISAWIVVLSEALVLFIFSSKDLSLFIHSLGLPYIPLVPVSSSQAVVGGVIGIGFAKGGWRSINYRFLIKILWGWILTPIFSAIIANFLLFFVQNVFQQPVF